MDLLLPVLPDHSRLLLLKKHCQEWKDFLAAQLESRLTLCSQHRTEMRKLRSQHTCCFDIAFALNQHSLNIIEFNSVDKAKRQQVRQQQDQEKVNLEAVFASLTA